MQFRAMKIYRMVAVAMGLALGTAAAAQDAALSANTDTLSPRGGTITLTAETRYETTPAALGWSLELPIGWTLVAVRGPNVPQVAADAGSVGTLDFAYTAAPARAAIFSVVVRYPAKVRHASIRPQVILRGDGQRVTLSPSAVAFSAPQPSADHPER
jgi:hypothetical protein